MAWLGRATSEFLLLVNVPECSGMHRLKCKGLTVLCCDSAERGTVHSGEFNRQKRRVWFLWKEPCHFVLFFNVLSVWDSEGSHRRWVKPCHPSERYVRVSLWLSESLSLLGFFFPWIKYLVRYLWLMVDLYCCLWPSLSLPQLLSVHMWGRLCPISSPWHIKVFSSHFSKISESFTCLGEACAQIAVFAWTQWSRMEAGS